MARMPLPIHSPQHVRPTTVYYIFQEKHSMCSLFKHCKNLTKSSLFEAQPNNPFLNTCRFIFWWQSNSESRRTTTYQTATVTTESLSDKEFEALSHAQTSLQYYARTGTNEMVQSQRTWPTLPDSAKCQIQTSITLFSYGSPSCYITEWNTIHGHSDIK